MPVMISPRRALLESLLALMRDRPPTGFGLPDTDCGIVSQGRPPVGAGDYFWGIHGNGGSASFRTSYIRDLSIKVTLSVRVKSVQADLIGSAVIESEDGLDDVLESFFAFLASNQFEWMNRANGLIGVGRQGFHLPAFDAQDGPVTEVGPDWWRASAPTPGPRTQPGPAGLTVPLTVSGFRREQYIESAT